MHIHIYVNALRNAFLKKSPYQKVVQRMSPTRRFTTFYNSRAYRNALNWDLKKFLHIKMCHQKVKRSALSKVSSNPPPDGPQIQYIQRVIEMSQPNSSKRGQIWMIKQFLVTSPFLLIPGVRILEFHYLLPERYRYFICRKVNTQVSRSIWLTSNSTEATWPNSQKGHSKKSSTWGKF